MQYYLWLKALHIIAVISWMAGLFYLPRLYVYHSEVLVDSEADQLFKIMELKLLRIIINPAMIATFILGILLIHTVGFKNLGGWIHVKLLLVFLMSAFHGMLARWRKQFAQGKRPYSAKFFRFANEIPTLLMIFIVLLAVLKPF